MRAYASNAQIPLKDVAVAVTDSGGSAIALRLTNRSGMFDTPIVLQAPMALESQAPDNDILPFATVNLYARLTGYEEIYIENIQIFDSVITDQNLEMIPLSEFPESFNRSQRFETSKQNL